MATESGASDIKAQVLHTTLIEISTTRSDTDSSNNTQNDGEVTSDAPECCVICLDAVAEPCSAVPCSHAHFDLLCLLSWLEQRATCPLCNAAVSRVRYTDARTGENVFSVPNAAKGGAESAGALARRPWRRRGTDSADSYDSSDGRRRRWGPGTTPNTGPDVAIQRRRHVYRHLLYSLHVGSNRLSQYRPHPTPVQFAASPHLVSRARLWVRRELQVFAFLSDPQVDTPSTSGGTGVGNNVIENGGGSGITDNTSQQRQEIRRRNNAEFLLEYIVAIIKTVDIQGSAGQAEDMLVDFLGRSHARLFLHELRSWLRSPSQSLATWDREVQYPDVPRKRNLDDPESGGERQERPRYGRGQSGNYWRPSYDRKRRKIPGAGGQNEETPRQFQGRDTVPSDLLTGG
ncbi:hypothetical protein B0H63DRAFT_472082 [Podospora didyma]|uniref:RING-type E3 ubiquitin transferase n=1 Tax=Podospora didyma TaxID=330526 RepID=A0AAE0NP52_9PEZI|nr:hypothetical protein B0H63DRAFT_472082 [Podospora didyma]